MKNLLYIPVAAIGTALTMIFLPWWSFALWIFAVSYFYGLKPWVSFLSGFISAGLVWGGYSFWIDVQNDSLLSGKMAKLMGVGNGIYLIILTTIVGGLVGGFSALTGRLARFSLKDDE